MRDYNVDCNICGNIAAAHINSGNRSIATLIDNHEASNPGHVCTVLDLTRRQQPDQDYHTQTPPGIQFRDGRPYLVGGRYRMDSVVDDRWVGVENIIDYAETQVTLQPWQASALRAILADPRG